MIYHIKPDLFDTLYNKNVFILLYYRLRLR